MSQVVQIRGEMPTLRERAGALYENLTRRAILYGASVALPVYLINEYPKSGGTWVGQMVSSALGLPFPRNQVPPLRTAVFHGHYLSPLGLRRVITVWRDGRDVMVSYYFHHHRRSQTMANKVRRVLAFPDPEDVASNLPIMIERCFSKPISPPFSWSDFAKTWWGRKGAVPVRYEDLRVDTAKELRRVIHELSGKELDHEKADAIAAEFSFERQTGRAPGTEDRQQFQRKGIVGDWKNYFNREARQVFDYYAGDELIRLGYETDHEWVIGD